MRPTRAEMEFTMKKLTAPSNALVVAAICGSCDASIKTTDKIFEEMGVDYATFFSDKVDSVYATAHGTTPEKARKSVATLLNTLLGGYVKVTAADWTVTHCVAALRRWSHAHMSYEDSITSFRTEIKRAVYASIVGQFECPKEYDAAKDALDAYRNADATINGTKAKDGSWKVKPAAMRIQRYKTELGVAKKSPECAELAAELTAKIEKLEKFVEDTDLDALKLDADDAMLTYANVSSAKMSLAIKCVGGVDKTTRGITRAKAVLADLEKRNNG